jgi:hypothetical protein
MLLVLFLAPLQHVSSRTVHETNTVDLFPQGTFTAEQDWTLGSYTSFAETTASYTDSMVEDNRLTMFHQRPQNLDSMIFWAQSSPTESNNSIGSPDSSTTWTTGPVIELTSFNAFGSTGYAVMDVHVVVAFSIPDPLYQDSVRFSMEYDGNFESLITFSHTQSGLDFMSNHWTYNVSSLTDWDWDTIQNSVMTLDYVSVGSTDDSQLSVDAVGIQVTMQTPWYGGEFSAQFEFSGHEMPILPVNLSLGISENMALSQCGLQSSTAGDIGRWTSEVITTPAQQRIGRVHYSLQNETVDDVILEFSFSDDGSSFSEFTAMDENMLLPDSKFTQLRVSVVDSCISTLTVDVNDPTLFLSGRILGDVDGLDPSYSRWLLFVNDQLVTNQPVELSNSFSQTYPIGAFMSPGDESVLIELKTWFTWDSSGNSSTTSFEVTSLSVSGGYEIEWDENPVCVPVGDQSLTEDGGGRILPFLHRCTDDRTDFEDLTVLFSNSNPELVTVDSVQGDVRISLQPEASGQATIVTTVLDFAGNEWSETFLVNVQNVDDSPQLDEFQSLVPVELAVASTVPFSFIDIDSTNLTATTNRSWASVNLADQTLTITAPVSGFTSILVTLCDQSTCSERILDLEVLALPDLVVEEIDIGQDSIQAGDVHSIRILVRNIGQAQASMVSVRCESNAQLIDLATLPILDPGQVDYVVCQWQVPDSESQVQIKAIIDRGLEIDEGQEDNNQAVLAVTIEPSAGADGADSQSSAVSDGMFWGGTVVLILGIAALFLFLTPAKIKKIE